MGLQEGGGDLAPWEGNVLRMVPGPMQAKPCWGTAALLHISRGLGRLVGLWAGSWAPSITQPSEATVKARFVRMRLEGWGAIHHPALRVRAAA